MEYDNSNLVVAVEDVRDELAAHSDKLDEIAAGVNELSDALWDINYTLMPAHRKLWYRIQGWRQNRRQARNDRTRQAQLGAHARVDDVLATMDIDLLRNKAESMLEEASLRETVEAIRAVRGWMNNPTSGNTDQLAHQFVLYDNWISDPTSPNNTGHRAQQLVDKSYQPEDHTKTEPTDESKEGKAARILGYYSK